MSSGKRRPFCLGLNVLNKLGQLTLIIATCLFLATIVYGNNHAVWDDQSLIPTSVKYHLKLLRPSDAYMRR